jgi:integrase
MTAYLQNRSTQLRPGTLAGMANDLACFGEFLTTNHPDIARLTNLTRAHIEQFSILARTRTYRGHRTNDHLIGPSAAAHTMITLRCFLDDITAWDWADAPTRRLVFASDIPRQPRPLPRALPADTDAALMAAVAQHPDPFARNGLTIIRGTGLRIGELLDLELDCVVDYGTTGSWLRVPLGKLATERAVPLDEAILAAPTPWPTTAGRNDHCPTPATPATPTSCSPKAVDASTVNDFAAGCAKPPNQPG